MKRRWYVAWEPDGDWWTLVLWRLEITYRPCALVHRRWPQFHEAPGVWIFDWGYWHIIWWRKWTVWRDHPWRWHNIQLYDQFGTFGGKADV